MRDFFSSHDERSIAMINDTISPAHSSEGINPVLDFTEDSAFVGVKIPRETGKTFTGQAAVVTGDGRIIPWSEEDFFENHILPVINSPVFIEPRWSPESIAAFRGGAQCPDTTGIHQRVRAYLQKYLGLRHCAEYDLVAFWIMGTYLKPLFKCYPILFFNAPYESGKTRCLEAVGQLSLNGKWFGEITPAAFRRYAESKITFCLDELKDLGLKNDSPLISILLNAYNGAEVAISEPARKNGWLPVIFKITSPVAMGNIQEIKNEALKSRTIQIRTEYNPSYKNITLPGDRQNEPAQIRDGLYGWFLRNWKPIRERYQTYPEIPGLSAREMDSYKPLLAMASLVNPETARRLTDYALAVREEKNLVKKATDDRLDLLMFLKRELEARSLDGDCVQQRAISNRELADAWGRKNSQRINYKRFIGMVSELHVISDLKDYHGSKYFVFNRPEIDRQLQLMATKS